MKYVYQAMDCTGKEKKGSVDAKSESEANGIIKERGMFPISIKKAESEVEKFENEENEGYMKEDSKKNLWVFAIAIYVIGILTGVALVHFIRYGFLK